MFLTSASRRPLGLDQLEVADERVAVDARRAHGPRRGSASSSRAESSASSNSGRRATRGPGCSWTRIGRCRRRQPARRRPSSGTSTTRKPSGSSNVSAVLGPVRVGGRDRIGAEACRHGPPPPLIAEVEHEQRFGVRRRSAVPAARGELEVRAGARDHEKDAVVAVVIAEAADLGQPDAVAVERDDLLQALRMPRYAYLDRRRRGCRMRCQGRSLLASLCTPVSRTATARCTGVTRV